MSLFRRAADLHRARRAADRAYAIDPFVFEDPESFAYELMRRRVPFDEAQQQLRDARRLQEGIALRTGRARQEAERAAEMAEARDDGHWAAARKLLRDSGFAPDSEFFPEPARSTWPPPPPGPNASPSDCLDYEWQFQGGTAKR